MSNRPRLRLRVLRSSRFPVNPFRLYAARRPHFRRRSLVHPAAAMATIADASRIVRAAADLAGIAVDASAGAVAVAADADAAAVAVRAAAAIAVLGASFLLPSTLRHGRPRIIPASRARRKDTSPRCFPENLSQSSRREARRILLHPLRTRMTQKRRRAIRHRSVNTNRLRRIPRRMNMSTTMGTKKRTSP